VSVDWANSAGVDLHLELGSTGGRRAGLERALREAVRDARLAPGTRLPSTRALAVQLGMARNTVAAAYDQLVAEGYLSVRTGSGTVVALPASRPAAGSPSTVDTSEPRLDLRPGRPDISLFPTAGWLRSSRRALSQAPAATYGYAGPAGHPALRAAVAEYVGRTRGVVATADRVVITSGYVQALALLTDVLGRRGPAVVAMEDPGLGFHRDVVEYAHGQVVPLPVDERGARTDLLSTVDFASVRAAVLTPAHQYPLGMTLHPQRRQAAVQWASVHSGLIIEDDYDGEFRYDRQPVGALQGMAPDRVAYVGTTAKTLAPALRLAWLVLPEPLLELVTKAKLHADMHTGTLGQLTLADFITTHAYDRHIRACRMRYRRRRDQLVARLAPLARRGVTVRGIAAGLHAVVELPTGAAGVADVMSRAARHGLAVGSVGAAALVIGYGTPTERRFPAALDTLARVLRAAT
jgi:GntR family transcriptional regulator/MocR family aminotransferase